MASSQEIKIVVVIGGGPSGLVAVKTLKDTPEFKAGRLKIIAFERRSEIGGVWLPAEPPPSKTKLPDTPLYDSLTTNLPHPIMAFRDFPFPPETPLYPPASTVLQYLQDYAKHFDLLRHYHFNRDVVGVDLLRGKWLVKTINNHASGNFSMSGWNLIDAVIVANGHYGQPFLPEIPGLDKWQRKGRASHSIWYRNASPFQGKVVVIVGNGPSAADIGAEVEQTATKVYRSIRTESPTGDNVVGPIASLDPDDGTVHLADGTTVPETVDHIILATGYQFSLPFISGDIMVVGPVPIPRSPPKELPEHLYNSNEHIVPLAQHIFSLTSTISPESLVFLGLPKRVAPFPLVEAQAKVFVELLAGRIQLDIQAEKDELWQRYERFREKWKGDEQRIAKAWHQIPEEGQFDYREHLVQMVGDDIEKMVPTWQRRIYKGKLELRAIWKELEKNGKAKELVKGVSEEDEWVDLMDRLLLENRDNNNNSASQSVVNNQEQV